MVAESFDIEVRRSVRHTKDDNSSQLIEHVEHISDFFSSNYFEGFVVGADKSTVFCYFEPAKPNATSDEVPLIFAQIYIENGDERSFFYIEPSQNDSYIFYKTDDIFSNVLADGLFK